MSIYDNPVGMLYYREEAVMCERCKKDTSWFFGVVSGHNAVLSVCPKCFKKDLKR